MIRRFHFVRNEDVSGVSGCGKIAEGCVFFDGTVVLCWLSEHPSMNFYKSLADVEFIHGHHGKTKIVFDDPEDVSKKDEN